MNTYFIFLRGINVGGKRKVLMVDLKQTLEHLGYQKVKTYIQSGNVIATHASNAPQVLEQELYTTLLETFGFEIPVILRTYEQLATLLKTNPWQTELSEQLHVTFLKHQITLEQQSTIPHLEHQSDAFQFQGQDILLKCTSKYSDTKYSNQFFEKHLKTPATTRNWKTITTLIDLFNTHFL